VSVASDKKAVYPSLKGKKVLVTGGGSGIGAGIVEAFVEQQADVTFFDIIEEDSQALVQRLSNGGTGPSFVNVDLKDVSATQAKIRELVELHGAFDVLVNNAANDDRHHVGDVTEAYWDDRIAVNLKHVFFCSQAVLPSMRANGGGAIINLGSISWHLGMADMPLYQTCKAAIEGLTRSLARDVGPDNIRVTCVVPGNVRTPRQLMWYTAEGEADIVNAQCIKGRLVPEDIASLVLFLASDDARLMTGHEYFIDAGWR